MADSQGSDAFREEMMRRLRARRPWSSFTLHEQFDEGGMSLIYRAYDDDLRRDVALKVMRDDAAKRGAGPSTHALRVGRFIDEMQVTAQLDHPSIVPVHEIGVDARDRPYFTMKLVRGETLRAAIQHARSESEGWTKTRMVLALLKVCEAMEYAHSKRVVHRDLKPSNVMVGRFGEVYVMDWGLARLLDRPDAKDIRIREPEQTSQVDTDRHDFENDDPGSPLYTMDGDVVGTPAYMSPEQALGQLERVGPQSDVYSIGAILYHLLTGRVPYVAPGSKVDNYAIWRWVREGPPDELAIIAADEPEELRAICEKAMARELERRYASMAELAADLRAYLEGRVVAAHARGPWAELRKWVARNTGVAALLAALFVALAAGGYGIAVKEAERAEEVEETARALLAAELVSRAADLGPIDPSGVAPREAWLEEARSVLAHRADDERETRAWIDAELRAGRASAIELPPDGEALFRAQDAELRASRLAADLERVEHAQHSTDDAQILRVEAAYWRARADELAEMARSRKSVRCDGDEARMRWGRREMLVDNAAQLAQTIVGRVEADLLLARSLVERTLEAPDADRAWRQALASIEVRELCPLYEGRSLTRQVGLIPLRQNDAELWEFWHVSSGERPELGADGRWIVGADTGVVLVLVPGARVAIGEERREVELDWYFIAAHELTQGQWFRLTAAMPSEHASGTLYRDAQRIDRRHPVEQVSHEECVRALARVGLALPTRAQWQHAACAGSTARYVYGDTPAALEGKANFGDRSWAEHDPSLPANAVLPPVDDGFVFHAPVGSFAANGWGLHDVLGNVREWCLDWHAARGVSFALTPGAGAVVPELSRTKSCCGMDFKTGASLLRASESEPLVPTHRDDFTGVRAARAVFP